MTSRKNKKFCDKCYRTVNKSRLQRCIESDCGLAHEKEHLMPNNVVDFKPKIKAKSQPQQHQVLQATVDEPVEEMMDFKYDEPEVGYISRK